MANASRRVSLSEVEVAIEDEMSSAKHRLGLPAGIQRRVCGVPKLHRNGYSATRRDPNAISGSSSAYSRALGVARVFRRGDDEAMTRERLHQGRRLRVDPAITVRKNEERKRARLKRRRRLKRHF